MKIPVNNRPLFWRNGSFRPQGPLELVGKPRLALNDNPFNWEDSGPTWGARVIVGFNRRGRRAVTMNQLVRLVRRIRLEQVGDPAATFVAQRGLYRHGTGEIVDEPGAQVILINTPNLGTTPAQFEKQVEKLSEDIATELGQDEVIVEIQENGFTRRTFGMGRR